MVDKLLKALKRELQIRNDFQEDIHLFSEGHLQYLIKGQKLDNLRKEEKELFKDKKPLSLISFDADSIKDYVFSGFLFKSITGASKNLESIDRLIISMIKKYDGIDVFVGGGSGVLLAPSSLKEDIKKEIIAIFKDKTFGATCSVVVLNVYIYEIYGGLDTKKPDFLDKERYLKINGIKMKWLGYDGKPKEFYNIFSILSSKMAQVKMDRVHKRDFLTDSTLTICQNCRREIAEKTIRAKNRTINVCTNCYNKYNFRSSKINSSREYPDSISDIDDKLIAVIYGDANNMGTVWSNISDIEKYKEFSEGLNKSIKDAFEESVNRVKLYSGSTNLYFDPILSGDDVCVFLPADKAHLFLKEFDDLFLNKIRILIKEKRIFSDPEKIENIKMSYGVAYVSPEFPLKLSFEASMNLMHKSKKTAYKRKRNTIVSFKLLTNNDLTLDLESTVGENIRIVNPYGLTIEEYLSLFDLVNELKKEGLFNAVQKSASMLNDNPYVARLGIAYYLIHGRSAEESKNIKFLEFKDKYPKILEDYLLIEKHEDNSPQFETKIYQLLEIERILRKTEKKERGLIYEIKN